MNCSRAIDSAILFTTYEPRTCARKQLARMLASLDFEADGSTKCQQGGEARSSRGLNFNRGYCTGNFSSFLVGPILAYEAIAVDFNRAEP